MPAGQSGHGPVAAGEVYVPAAHSKQVSLLKSSLWPLMHPNAIAERKGGVSDTEYDQTIFNSRSSQQIRLMQSMTLVTWTYACNMCRPLACQNRKSNEVHPLLRGLGRSGWCRYIQLGFRSCHWIFVCMRKGGGRDKHFQGSNLKHKTTYIRLVTADTGREFASMVEILQLLRSLYSTAHSEDVHVQIERRQAQQHLI